MDERPRDARRQRNILLACALASSLLLLLSLATVSPASPPRTQAHLDRSFAGRGFLVNGRIGKAQVAEDGRGRLLLAGAAGGELIVARYRPNGRLDRSFGRRGLARVTLSGIAGNPVTGASTGSIVVGSGGKIILGGSFSPSRNPDARVEGVIVELRPNGVLASGFGGSRAEGGQPGRVVLPLHEEVSVLALQGKSILIGGSSGGAGFLERLRPDGHPDLSFGGDRGGGVRVPPGRPQGPAHTHESDVAGILLARVEGSFSPAPTVGASWSSASTTTEHRTAPSAWTG